MPPPRRQFHKTPRRAGRSVPQPGQQSQRPNAARPPGVASAEPLGSVQENSREPPPAGERAPHAGECPPTRADTNAPSGPVRGRAAPGRPRLRPAHGAGGDSRRRWRSRRARAKTAQGSGGRKVQAPAAVRRRLESEGYPAQRADLCRRTDSTRRRAPAAADTRLIGGAFIKPGQRARVGGPSLRPARIELAPPERRAHRARAELRRSRTVPLRRTQRRYTARRS